MTTRYRIVHFVPDPFVGGRVPLAALVEHDGKASVVQEKHMPCAGCGCDALAPLGRSHEEPLSFRRAASPWPDSTLSVRAKVLYAGGSKPAVRFESGSEENEFTLRATEELVRSIGRYLYQEIELEAVVQRDADGAITGGTIEDFEPVLAEDPRPPWREWFRKVHANDDGTR